MKFVLFRTIFILTIDDFCRLMWIGEGLDCPCPYGLLFLFLLILLPITPAKPELNSQAAPGMGTGAPFTETLSRSILVP